MIITISGTQGEGKTTILNRLKDGGFAVIENHVARSVLTKLNLSLNDINKHLGMKRRFQDEVLKGYNDLFKYDVVNSNTIYVLERSLVDVFVYAAISLGPFNEFSDWLNQYFDSCYYMQTKVKLNVFLTGRHISAENDGVRSVNEHFRSCVNALMLDYYKKFPSRYEVVEETDLNKRYSEVLRVIHEAI